jgi:hypothetical protein
MRERKMKMVDSTEDLARESLNPARRRFMAGAAGVGVITFASSVAISSAHAQGLSGDELPQPAGIRPKGMLDNRFPVTYRQSVPQGMAVLTEFFAALASRDLRAIAKTLHYPFAIYEGTHPIVVASERDLLANPPPSLNTTGRGNTPIVAGSYDMLDSLELHTFNPVNVGLSLVFSRYSAGGEKLDVHQGIYSVTNNDGRWAIQLASLIESPVAQTQVDYDDAAEAFLRERRNWMLGWTENDAALLSRNRSSPGRQASVGGGTGAPDPETGQRGGGGPGAFTFFSSARKGQPMEPYGARGVPTRLQVRDVPRQGAGEAGTNQYPFDYFNELAGGGVGKYGYTLVLPDTRLLHATVNKAHTYGGYIRYTDDGVYISETRNLGIITYDNADRRWGSASSFGQSMYRDRTNDRVI